MKYLANPVNLLIMVLTIFSCSDGANGINGADGKDGRDGRDGGKGYSGDDGLDGAGCDFGEDGEFYVMVCGEEEKARWAKAWCGMVPYDPAKMTCSASGILSFRFADERDGKTYNAVIIGYQTWMAENLNYRNTATDPLGSCYDNSPANCDIYGRLYDWKTAMGVCPEGWHLPDREEWTELIIGWEIGNSANRLGFAALPGGGALDGDFLGIDEIGLWWNATEYEGDESEAYIRAMHNDSASVNMLRGKKTDLMSVRCVAD